MFKSFSAAILFAAVALVSGCVSTKASVADEAKQIATTVAIASPTAGKIVGDYRLVLEGADALTLNTKPLGISLSVYTFQGELGALFKDRANAAATALFTGKESPTAQNVLTLKPSIEDDRLVVLTRGYWKAAARARIATRLAAKLDRPSGAVSIEIAPATTLVEDERESSNAEAVPILLAVADASFQKALTEMVQQTASKANAGK